MSANKPYNVFLSWAGEGSLSHRVAEILHYELPKIHPELKPFFSSEINKGEEGGYLIHRAMDCTKASIVCLTRESQSKPWINYEAGYIRAKGGSVCALLIDFDNESPHAPIGMFQYTKLTPSDFKKMMLTILCKCEFNSDFLKDTDDEYWDNILKKIHNAKKSSV